MYMQKVYSKLAKFQKEMGAVIKNAENPFYKSKYADINQYIACIKPVLDSVGLVLLQPLTHLENKPAIATIIADPVSGESISWVTPITELADPQKQGGAVSYFRRYSLQSLLLLEAEDDDGNAASKTPQPKTVKEELGF